MKMKIAFFSAVVFLMISGTLLPCMAYGAPNQKQAADFAQAFQYAVENENSSFVSEHLAYPIRIYYVGDKMLFGGADSAEIGYESWMTPYLYNLITKTSPARLVKLLDIRRDKDGKYKVHKLLFTGDPSDFKYSEDGIYSAKQLMHVIAALRKGATDNCKKCVANVIEFPITNCIHGRWVKIRNKAEFIKHYDQIVTPEVRDLMAVAWEQKNWTGFYNGIMFGDGAIWITSLGHKNSKGAYVWETKVAVMQQVAPPGCPIESTPSPSAMSPPPAIP